ncbi:hypothetical protein K7432_001104 [Basidiobolus ranarum]|uniref:RING-type E3 ubiquitin transferase n=1 Tax=Basidiobolus ranarum TaxID=34480 RepID=A0ABR2WA60_9FUNG
MDFFTRLGSSLRLALSEIYSLSRLAILYIDESDPSHFTEFLYFGPYLEVQTSSNSDQSNQNSWNEIPVMNSVSSKGALSTSESFLASSNVFYPSINLRMTSLKLLKTSEANTYQLRFTFDAEEECNIRLFWMAKEDQHTKANIRLHQKYSDCPKSYSCSSGIAQQFILPEDQLLQVSKYCFKDLVMQPKINDFRSSQDVSNEYQSSIDSISQIDQVCHDLVDVWYPLVILMETVPTGDTPHTALLTFCNFTINDEREYNIQPLKQKFHINDTTFLVQKIYGRSQVDDGISCDEPPFAKNATEECIICLTETVTTTILPCRHSCLCKGCAEELQSRSNCCPICRQSKWTYHCVLRAML